jgi:hypothetical protein
MPLGRVDRELLSQLEAVLRREGIHHRLVRCRILGSLIEVAELDGDREAAKEFVRQKLEIAREHDRLNRKDD